MASLKGPVCTYLPTAADRLLLARRMYSKPGRSHNSETFHMVPALSSTHTGPLPFEGRVRHCRRERRVGVPSRPAGTQKPGGHRPRTRAASCTCTRWGRSSDRSRGRRVLQEAVISRSGCTRGPWGARPGRASGLRSCSGGPALAGHPPHAAPVCRVRPSAAAAPCQPRRARRDLQGLSGLRKETLVRQGPGGGPGKQAGLSIRPPSPGSGCMRRERAS